MPTLSYFLSVAEQAFNCPNVHAHLQLKQTNQKFLLLTMGIGLPGSKKLKSQQLEQILKKKLQIINLSGVDIMVRLMYVGYPRQILQKYHSEFKQLKRIYQKITQEQLKNLLKNYVV